MAHIHLYRQWPPTNWQHWVGCLNDTITPDLTVGDTIDCEGITYGALPCWKGDILKVQTDFRSDAQVATPIPEEPALDIETKQLIGGSA